MKFMRLTLIGMLVSAGAVAQNIKIVGHVDQLIKSPSSTSTLSVASASVKPVRFLKIELSDNAHAQIEEKAKDVTQQDTMSPTQNTQLGMNNVPVLDQGGHGSCVTFANTAAIDAALNKGDYVSQLCLLQLGRYLEDNGYVPNGWDGSLGPIVLNEITTFGIISKTQQIANGCGGLTQYPMSGSIGYQMGNPMTPTEYHELSDQVNSPQIRWSAVLDDAQVFIDKINPNETLAEVKKSLNAGDRLTFGVLLPGVQFGTGGAVGKYHVTNDTWLLTPEIIDELSTGNDFAGHEMVITGYDDQAVAIDAEGRTHTGLLTLRNSWGVNLGDKGNFYMTYAYFKTLTIEVQRIRSSH